MNLYPKNLPVVLILAITQITTTVIGCGPRNTNAATGAVVGGALGAGGGAAIGSASGNTGRGAVSGAAVGAITGAAIGSIRDSAEIDTEQQDAFMKKQDQMRRKQDRELEDLKRQRYYNDYMKSRYPQAETPSEDE
jgi:uncharacterized protein YcfJ